MKRIYWVIIVLFLFLAAIGTFLFLYFQAKKNISLPNPNVSTTISITPSTIGTISNSPAVESSPSATKVKIFMIAKDDNGASGKQIGCGDSAVAVTREVPETKAVLKAAMEQLVSIKDENYGQSGLYNPLFGSSLNLVSASIDDSGKATVKFTGTLQLVGGCEDPRIQAQLEETALQFSSVKSTEIWINDKTLKEIMSLKG
ncbi:MAG: hypothetical protein HW405_658 [Candidatus Berkelbacteria bacterium]|nr:hypothetical protein [Candidatus Berkelbacteria bacterium]